MKSNFIKRIMALTIIGATLLTALPIGASATEIVKSTVKTNQLVQVNGQLKYCGSDGRFQIGWILINGKWYFCYPDGIVAGNIWINNYYVGSDGIWIPNATVTKTSANTYNPTTYKSAVQVNTNTNNSETQVSADKKSVKTVSDLETYLDNNYSTLQTPIGTLKFTYDIDENDSNIMDYDFWVQTDYGDIEDSKYDIDMFAPYDLEYSIKISDGDKKKTISLLKKLQEDIADDAMNYFPNKKIEGGFYSSGRTYSIDFLSWKNYSDDSDYDETEITDFQWDDKYDDYNFSDSEDDSNQDYDDTENIESSTSSTLDDYYDYSSKGSNETYVSGYYRNGKYVKGYYRTKKDSTTSNNYSHKGNTNPHNGKKGYSKK